jgi:DNA sulfur modification protein DndB
VPHKDTQDGIVRTRSLFISLNKRAVPVKRKDIIILDEVDLPAIVTRRLIDSDPRFSRDIVDVERFGNAIPASSTAWTSIGNFYDANSTIIHKVIEDRNENELEEACKIRLPERRMSYYQSCVADFYENLASLEPMLRRVLDGNDAAKTIKEARSAAQARLLARPIGLKIFTNVAAEIRKTHSLQQTYRELKRVPLSMKRDPFAGIIWDVERGLMTPRGESLANRLLLYMLGFLSADTKLRLSYAEWLGENAATVKLPRRLPAVR